ncbi:hypothetical protein ACOJUR_12345 [Alicyclobacillus tolerans]|uniref:hypothetical protein n=1 Tax=Alicyclobacillus tolerans TaxID=90970 RepID=UPI003B800C1D
MAEKNVELDLSQILPKKIIVRLKENQFLCETCQGLSLILSKNSTQGDGFNTCHLCAGRGYFEKCNFCGELKDWRTFHNCQGVQENLKNNRNQKTEEKWDKAKKITYAEACKSLEMVNIDDEFLPVSETLDFIALLWAHRGEKVIPKVWGVKKVSISLCAEDIIELELEDLCEDVFVQPKDIEDLQAFLDEWCNRPSVRDSTTCYFRDEKLGIVITEEEVEKRFNELAVEQAQFDIKQGDGFDADSICCEKTNIPNIGRGAYSYCVSSSD